MQRCSTLAQFVFAGLGLAATCTPAAASWSIGAEAGLARLDVICRAPSPNCDRRGSAAGLHGGYTFANGWGVRLAWQQTRGFVGSDTTSSGPLGGSLRADTLSVAGTWRTRIAPFDAELRAGVASVDATFTYQVGGSGTVSRRTTQPLVGAALDWPLSNTLAVRVDLQATRAEVATTSGPLTTATVGLIARF